MQPHPQPHQQGHYPPLQSRGFNPPPQQVRPPQQLPYQQPVQPAPSGYIQHYQNHPQYQQQRPAQFYQQRPQQFAPPQQQRYAPQPNATPHPPPAAPHGPNQRSYPPAPAPTHSQYVPFTSYSQPPVVPPVVPPARANSRSPDKAGRPLPAPAAAPGPRQPQNATAPPPRGFVPPAQPQYANQSAPYTRANPPTSSFAGLPTSHSFPRSQSFQAQPHVQAQPPVQPQPQMPPQPRPPVHHTPPAHAHQSLPHAHAPSPIHGTPPASPLRSPDSTTKRPLPAPPGGIATSPPATPSRSGPPGASAAVSPPQRRALPYSPTSPPSAEVARSNGRSAIKPPQRSSTLPTPLSQDVVPVKAPTSGSRDDTDQPSIPRTGPVDNTSPVITGASLPLRNAGFALPPSVQSKSSGGFSLPQQQKPTQSLAFRLASLSLQEEQKRPVNYAPRAPEAPVPAPNGNAVPSSSRSRSPVRPVLNLDDAPPTSSIRRSPFESQSTNIPALPQPPPSIPAINVTGSGDENRGSGVSISVSQVPSIAVSSTPSINVSEAPSISVSPPSSINSSEVPTINIAEAPIINISEAPSTDDVEGASITVSEATPKITVSELPEISASSMSSGIPDIIVADLEGTLNTSANAPAQKRKGLICYGCGNGILGRIVSAMGGRWHPACFKCSVCSELLEHVSSYEHAGKPYCHLDYHEKFAPQCYHCRTPIIDERFITLDDPALGKRMYHEQHFFCAECGDPFLAPTIPGKQNTDDEASVVAQDDDVGFTVYKGHPYCEACHVRLRYPKCKRCKKSIRDGMQAVEALGGKWCWECFLCAGCEKPFEDPAFFQRDNKAYCEPCFSVIVKSEL